MQSQREHLPPATSKRVGGARIETLEGVGVAILHDTVIVYWTTASTEARVRWSFDTADKARAANPHGVLVLQLIARSSSPPDAAARRVGHQRFSETGGAIRRMVTVPLGDEFWTAIVRAIMRGVFVVSGHSKKHLVATKGAAIDLLLRCRTGVTPTHEEIEDTIQELEALLHTSGWGSARPTRRGAPATNTKR